MVCAWLVALPALAQPRIEWQASAGCPTADDARTQIQRLLRAPLDELAIQLTAAVRLRRESASLFAATIQVQQDGVARTRVLRSADCGVLAHACAVIVALAIDPSARIDEPNAPVRSADTPQQASPSTTPPRSADPRSPPPAAAINPPPSAAADSDTRSPPTEASRIGTRSTITTAAGTDTRSLPSAAADANTRSPQTAQADAGTRSPPSAADASEARPTVHAAGEAGGSRRSAAESSAAEGGRHSWLSPFVAAALGLSAGSLPKLAPGLALLGGLETTWTRAALRLSYVPTQRAASEVAPGLAGQVGLYAVAVEAGLHRYLALLELSSLAGFEAGMFTAQGSEGVFRRETKHPLWLGGYLGLGLALQVNTRFKLALRLDGIVALRRPSFVVRSDAGDERLLHRPNLLSGRAWLEFELDFSR